MSAHAKLLPVFLLAVTAVAGGDEGPPDKDIAAERKQQLLQVYLKAAEAYRFTLPDTDVELSLHQEPVFQWLNTARVGTPRVQHGAVYVWTNQGRAEVLATIFSQTIEDGAPYLYHEMHSLSTGRLQAHRDGALFWKPEQTGIVLRPFDEAPEPATNARLRMVQMRSLARKFSGHSINYDDTRWDLRLLPEPLYRMPESRPDLLDSAIFTMVSTAGTDPEVLIVIEAPVTDGQATWQYSLCRFTDLKTWVSLDDVEVWAFTNGTNGPNVDAGPSSRYRFSSEGTVMLP